MLVKYGLLVVAYLLGAIPFSIILGKKYKGIDVREHGSGNPGGTNSVRFLGRKIGMWVMFLDGSKAALIILLIRFKVLDSSQLDLFHPLAYGLAATFGHVFSVYIRFKGGKAVAATVGTFVAFNPIHALAMFAMFLLSLKVIKYVSIASTVAGLTIVVVSLIARDYTTTLYCVTFSLLIIFRHKKNYQNIKNHVEPKVTWI